MIKKLLSSLLVLAVLALSVPLLSIPVSAGTFGDLTYTISGSAVTITDCASTASGHLTIPSTIEGLPVTSIGASAIERCYSLTGATIPDSVTSIGTNAFYANYNMTSITIPDSVTSIGMYAFAGCSKLVNVIVPNSVTSIGMYAFNGCNSLVSMTIPAKTSILGNNVFYNSVMPSLTFRNMIQDASGNFVEDTGSYGADTIDLSKIETDNIVNIAFYSRNAVISGDITHTPASSVTVSGYTGSTAQSFATTKGHAYQLLTYTLTTTELTYTTTSGKVTITDCVTTAAGPVAIPSKIGSNPVTTIGNNAFQSCALLTSVTIPDGVTSIGNVAFKSCSALTSVTIPNSVTSIGTDVFYSCTLLTGVTIPNGVTSIGNNAFRDCPSLTNFTIPKSVTSIGSYAFRGCSSITGITIPDSVTSIGSYAFYNCTSLTSITIPNSVTSIGNYAFSNCTGLVSATLPAKTSIIGTSVFTSTTPSSITFRNMKQDASGNFYEDTGSYSAADAISFSKVVTTNAVNVAIYSRNATISGSISYTPASSVTIHGYIGSTAQSFAATKGHAFQEIIYTLSAAELTYTVNNGAATITDCVDTISGTVVIPSVIGGYPVAAIGNNAFQNCSLLTNITVPNSVTSIGNNAFTGCSKLTSVTIPDSVTSIGSSAFSACTSLTGVTIPNSVTSIGSSTFSGCSKLTSIIIPDSVTGIGSSAFSGCTSLISVTIHDGITSIGSSAFSGCSALTSVTIPDSVTSIGDSAFMNCTALTSATIPVKTSVLGTGVFTNTALSSLTFRNMKQDASGNFMDNGGYSAADAIDISIIETDDLVNVAIYSRSAAISGNITRSPASSVTVCGRINSTAQSFAAAKGHAFQEIVYTLTAAELTYTVNNGMVTITDCVTAIADAVAIPSEIGGYPVTSIGNNAFQDCAPFSSITIPDSVTSIGNNAFQGCTSLTSVTIPDSVTIIGGYVFYNCTSLTSVTIPDSVTSIGEYAFCYCSSLTSVTIPDSVTSIGIAAFASSALTSVTIPNSVTSIGDSAFSSCPNLKSFTIMDGSTTSLGNYLFGFATKPQSMFIPDGVTNFGLSVFFGDTSGLMLYCYDNSPAKTYAVNNGLSYSIVAPFALASGSPLVMGADMLTIPQGSTTVTALLSGFANTNITVHKNGGQILGDTFVGTGSEVRLMAGPLTAKTLTAVVMGDISGDGACDALDAFLCDSAKNSHTQLTGAYYTAANLDTTDPDIDIRDLSALMNRAVGIWN